MERFTNKQHIVLRASIIYFSDICNIHDWVGISCQYAHKLTDVNNIRDNYAVTAEEPKKKSFRGVCFLSNVTF